MGVEPDVISDKMAQLRAQYALKIDDHGNHLQALIKRLDGADAAVRGEILKEISDACHKLAGSGATFGFPGVTAHARDMEQMCIEGLKTDFDLGQDQGFSQRLEDLCLRLRQASAHQSPPPGKAPENIPSSRPQLHDSTRKKVLFVMEYTGPTAMQVLLEMDHFGFEARIIGHPAKLLDDLQNNGCVDAIVTGLVFNNDEGVAHAAIEKLRQDPVYQDIPIVVLTTLENMAARLAAVRMGVKAYMVKPVDMADLVDVLDRVTRRSQTEPFRVLIVDDDESLAYHTELVLEAAGMKTRVTADPVNIFEDLDEFSPELILLDLYMPGCVGQELAAVIRQREEYAGIPIVFLSGEADKSKQLSAMEMGGDDFLTKPIHSTHLISSVRIRVTRFRKLRSFMLRDSMTGLFNHTSTKQFLDTEIARVQRSTEKLAFVALDIDHFKNVNDSYGHAVGDRVIKSLARLLRQRLRGADLIGRMGGEEFAVIMPESDLDQAVLVFDQIREAFSEIIFHANETQFHVTISCGVAEFSHHRSATQVSDAADKALYAAKHAGRNQVVKASIQ